MQHDDGFRHFPESFSEIGNFGQPHGLRGEINLLTDYDFTPGKGMFVFVEIDSTMIPLQVAGIRQRSENAYIISLTGYDNDTAVKRFKGLTVAVDASIFGEITDNDPDEIYLEDLLGYRVMVDNQTAGKITGTDQSTDNPLMIIELTDNNRIMVPFADEYIESVDPHAETISLILPEGYIETFSF